MASSSVPSTEVEMERESTTQPNWLELPRDTTQNILQRLGTVEIITSACQVCPLWSNICKDPHMWRTIRISMNRNPRYYNYEDLVKICRNAVERSCDQLEEIDIEYFATDDLLQYIVDRASHLQRIRLRWCVGISDKGFSEAIEKLPQLEELGISYNYYLSKDSFEVVGRCCPLKSLKYGRVVPLNEGSKKRYEEVLAIAKTMPGLCHLKFSGNVLTKEGLLAILNGCSLLESLDLQECFGLYLSESLRKMCHEQIKDFMPPVEACFSNYFSDWDNLREALRGDSSDEDYYYYDDDYYYDF